MTAIAMMIQAMTTTSTAALGPPGPPARGKSELHPDRLARLRILDLEVLGLGEGERAGDEIAGYRLDAGVVPADVAVVEAAPGGDPVLGVGKLAL